MKPTRIIRHRKENLKKCSLRGLEERSDLEFYSYPPLAIPPLDGYLILDLDAPPLSLADLDLGLLLLDGTWRYAEKMGRAIENLPKRSLPPGWKTAYPRYQTGCSDPERGLASVEALFVAYLLMGKEDLSLLDHYYWKEAFLDLNAEQISSSR